MIVVTEFTLTFLASYPSRLQSNLTYYKSKCQKTFIKLNYVDYFS